jgi:hypothetical protein
MAISCLGCLTLSKLLHLVGVDRSMQAKVYKVEVKSAVCKLPCSFYLMRLLLQAELQALGKVLPRRAWVGLERLGSAVGRSRLSSQYD